jgi:hypothetical protein
MLGMRHDGISPGRVVTGAPAGTTTGFGAGESAVVPPPDWHAISENAEISALVASVALRMIVI